MLRAETADIEIRPVSEKVKATPVFVAPVEKKEKKKKIWTRTKIIFASVASVVLITAATLGVIFGVNNGKNAISAQSELTCYIVSFNPSVMITADENDEIIAVSSLNADGDTILCDDRFDGVVGENLYEGIDLVLQVGLETDYLAVGKGQTVKIEAVNNASVYAVKRAEEIGRHLDEKFGLGEQNIGVEGSAMTVDEFKSDLDMSSDSRDLDKMKDELEKRDRFVAPPPGGQRQSDGQPPPQNDALPEKK
jgi:hypothetical protein